jgi:hypothetical protein|tara:strand:- start:3337 stop:3669 length:333 start_codon:yes stop_codon:yes gene_type:complete
MASPAKIREALIKLMGAKKANREVMGGQGIPATPDDLNSAELGVRQARQEARQAQSGDPLATKAANIEEFEQLVGRSPTPDEINNRPLMERIVQSIKGPRKTPTEDDIPF